MNLTFKILLLLLLVTTISYGTAISVHKFSTTPALQELEAHADRKDVERVLTGFDVVRNAVHILTADYALWDDTYDYFYQQDPDYLESNYPIDTFINNSVDLAIFADKQGKILWSRVADRRNERLLSDNAYDFSDLAPFLDNAIETVSGAPISKSGITETNRGLLIFSSYSVLHSDDSGDSPGTLLFGRYLDQETISEIQQLVKISFTIAPLSQQQLAEIKNQKLDEQYRNNDDSFTWFLVDSDDQPILQIKLQLSPSSIDAHYNQYPTLVAFIVTTLSWLVVIAYLNWSVIQPLLSIGQFLSRIRHTGDYSARLYCKRKDEVGSLSHECDRLIEYIEEQNQKLEIQSKELKRMSLQDGLTGLSNRRHLDRLIEEYWGFHQRERRPLSFILCDIDHFKAYNDNYGHQAGDNALAAVALGVRVAVARKTDRAARYGGEEFALLLADTDREGAMVVAKRLQQEIANLHIPHEYSKVNPVITLSIGCSTITPDGTIHSKELIHQADEALYYAKANGRNQIVAYEQEKIAQR